MSTTGPLWPGYAPSTRVRLGHIVCGIVAQVLQVTDCREFMLEIRLLMSAQDSAILFDLRCELRESMMDYIRRDMPEVLARRRTLQSPEIIASS